MPITPFGWKDHGPPDLDAVNLEGANSHAGAYTDEVVAAEIAEAAGEAEGLATLDSESHLTASQVPPSVVSSSAEEVAEAVEGAITPAMPTGRRMAAFTYLIKGAVTVAPPTSATTGFSEALIRVKQNSAGAHAITTSGIVWNGGEPVWNTTANAVNLISVFTVNGGATWEGVGPQTGATGATGPEGLLPSKLLIPSQILVYKETGSNGTEKRQGLAETYPRKDAVNTLLLVSGTPIIAAMILPPKTVFSGLAFQTTTTEGTAANRTHLWVALLNAKLETLKASADYTSSTNTPLLGAANAQKGLLFTSQYESGASPELAYGLLVEVMSSTNPITIATHNVNSAILEALPIWQALGNVGQTTPGALPSPVVPSAFNGQIAYMVAF